MENSLWAPLLVYWCLQWWPCRDRLWQGPRRTLKRRRRRIPRERHGGNSLFSAAQKIASRRGTPRAKLNFGSARKKMVRGMVMQRGNFAPQRANI